MLKKEKKVDLKNLENAIPENISDFFKQNRVATVCFTDTKNVPYCFTGFFVLNNGSATLVFKSSYGTSHEDSTLFSSMVSGTVLPEQLDVLKIKGIQFTGRTLNQEEIIDEYISMYYKKYPFARVMGGYIWAVSLQSIKFTDNTLLFGNKTKWFSK